MANEITKADLDAARVEGEASGKIAGAAEERNRILEIVRVGEAKGLQAAAIELALDDAAPSVATVTRILSTIAGTLPAPKEAAPALHGADGGGAFWRDGPARLQ